MTNHKRGCQYICFNTHLPAIYRCVLFFYLLKIITSIIKANTIIVSATRPNNNKYIIPNNAFSIIVPPPLSSISYIK